MVGAVIAGAIFIVTIVALTVMWIVHNRSVGAGARRKHLAAADNTVNQVDDIVDRYYPQLDIVGQAMAADIRQVISKHRKDTVSR